MDDELAFLDATAQAQLIRRGELSPADAVKAAIDRIESLDGAMNAVIHRRFEAALAECERGLPVEAPFRGVPLLVKDLSADSAGDPAHQGSRVLRDAGHVATADSWLVGRYRKAGFVIVGRTNTPELGLTAVTEPLAYGPTRNPWDLERSPGGSSGGSAAAVAAGLCPVAHGSDGGGSIRIPASMCGLVGLKTSRGRTTMGPDRDESGLSVQHVLTRSVRDTAAVLDATAGPGLGDAVSAPPPSQPYSTEVERRPEPLRVALLAHNPRGDLHPFCEQAAHHSAEILESLGHHVEESYPKVLDDPTVGRRFLARWSVNAALGVAALGELAGRELGPGDVEPLTWAYAEQGHRTSGFDYALALAASSRFTRAMASFWESFDVLVTPTLGEPPPLVGELTPPANDPFGTQDRISALVPFTTHFNVTGQPAISLPLFWSEDHLPVGTQFVAAYGRENLLISLAAQLEEAEPWADRRPPQPFGAGGGRPKG